MGGTVLFQLMVVFVVIYISLMAIGINYATTFRVKNQIINILESSDSYVSSEPKIVDYLKGVSYYGGESKIEFDPNLSKVKCLNNTTNYCVEQIALKGGGCYYVVTTYVSLRFPLIGDLNSLPIKGETSIMGRLPNSNYDCKVK